MASYQTKARRQIMDFLAKDPDGSYTAEELTAALATAHGADAPGKSTVYRLVGKLVQEDQLRRFEPKGSHCFYYQLAGCGCQTHLHLKCTECGRLIHMKESSSAHLLRDVLRDSGFFVDGQRTLLFGRCDHCERNE